MSKCKYLIDISPYDPLCEHPCMLYGGGAVEAECETCQYRIEDLERENAKLREQVVQLKVDWEGERDYADQMEAKEMQAVAENAKLRDDLETQREAAWHNTIRNAREYKRVRDENDKLRKLASILCFCMQIHKQCDDCKLNGAKGEIAHDPLLACDGLHEMLRELEIEMK